MALRVFASAWGNATHWGSLRRLMDGLKFKGFAGLEASLSDLGDDADARGDIDARAAPQTGARASRGVTRV